MNEDLAAKACFACEGGTPPMTGHKAEEYHKLINSDWKIIDNKAIKREFIFKDFISAMEFVNKVADIANREGHHPDIYIYYNKINLELSTHAIKGLSENDFYMAAKIDKL